MSAADEVHDLELVAFAESGFSPFGALNDRAIEFDGDAIGLHAQRTDELSKGEGLVEVPMITIDAYLHSFPERTMITQWIFSVDSGEFANQNAARRVSLI